MYGLMEVLGHSDLETTQKYLHSNTETLAKAARLSGLLGENGQNAERKETAPRVVVVRPPRKRQTAPAAPPAPPAQRVVILTKPKRQGRRDQGKRGGLNGERVSPTRLEVSPTSLIAPPAVEIAPPPPAPVRPLTLAERRRAAWQQAS